MVPASVEVRVDGNLVVCKGPRGSLEHQVHGSVKPEFDDGQIRFSALNADRGSDAQTGTARAVVANMVLGVEKGFERKLDLVGVGYRAQVQGKKLSLSLGFSHPVEYMAPEGITIETPTVNQIVISGADKRLVGQVAANIRAYRPPEPYKGKGVKYSDERIVRKEAKKK